MNGNGKAPWAMSYGSELFKGVIFILIGGLGTWVLGSASMQAEMASKVGDLSGTMNNVQERLLSVERLQSEVVAQLRVLDPTKPRYSRDDAARDIDRVDRALADIRELIQHNTERVDDMQSKISGMLVEIRQMNMHLDLGNDITRKGAKRPPFSITPPTN